MSPRWTQVKKLDTVDAFREHVASLGVEIPIDEEVDPGGVLSTAVSFVDGSAGEHTIPNRFAVLPMEGWDGTTDGRSTELVRRRWSRFGASGAGLVWGEATAVRADGRANPNQLMIDEATVDELGGLRALLDDAQVAGLQLTHSGRFCRPEGDPRPRTAYEHPVLDQRVGSGAAEVFTDDELDELVEHYVEAAVLADRAGFDFVDVKHCHGYFLHELLSGHDRGGRYGGDFAGRTQFLRSVVGGIRDRVPSLAVAVRMSVFDLRPYTAGDGGVGVPDGSGDYPYAFGGDGTGGGIDLAETHRFFDLLGELGVGLVSTTAGSPYYNPHIQRPAYFPPSDGYQPPEDPLVGVARQLAATRELAEAHPTITVVGSGYSYLQDWLVHVGQAVVASGGTDLVGLGRMILSYPHLPADTFAGVELERRLICRTFSDCTTAPRNGLVSGCYPLDDFYHDLPQRLELADAKKRARQRLR